MAEAIVNPYEVEGEVDYDRLISEFGIKKIDEKLLKRIKTLAGEVHPYLSEKRDIFCSSGFRKSS